MPSTKNSKPKTASAKAAKAAKPAKKGSATGACCRTRKSHMRSGMRCLLGREDTAIGFHDKQWCLDPAVFQAIFQQPDIAPDQWLNHGVHHRCHASFILTEHRQYCRGTGDFYMWQPAGKKFMQLYFMALVGICMD